MQGNRGRDTGPELAVRRAAHQRGLRYWVNKRPIPNLRRTADLVFPGVQVAVFIDGCFWHSCPTHATRPEANSAFWAAKLDGNRARDAETDRALKAAGWAVIRVWEHESPNAAADTIEKAVRSRRARR